MLAVEVTMATASISWRERDGGGWFGFKDDTGIVRTATERRIASTPQTSRARGSGSLPPPATPAAAGAAAAQPICFLFFYKIERSN